MSFLDASICDKHDVLVVSYQCHCESNGNNFLGVKEDLIQKVQRAAREQAERAAQRAVERAWLGTF